MVIGELLYAVDIRPGDIERLQAKLKNLQTQINNSTSGATGGKQALTDIRKLRNEMESLAGEFNAGILPVEEYTKQMQALRQSALDQMNTMVKQQGVVAKQSTDYKQLAQAAGFATAAMNTHDTTVRKATIGQQLMLAGTRALRFQMVRLGPIGYGTSVMMTAIAQSMTGAAYATTGLDGKVARLRATFLTLSNAILLSGVGVLISLGVALFNGAKAFIQLEQAQADVAKTTNFTKDEIQELTEHFQYLSIEIGTSTQDLLDIAAVAGQLGVRGVKNVAEFSETLAKLAAVTDVVGEEGARDFARFLNITSTAVDEYGDVAKLVGNILNELENSTAATASEILHMSTVAAQAKTVVNLSRQDILAFSAALAATGLKAEIVGTNWTKIFDKMVLGAINATREGRNFAAVANLTLEEFQKMMREDPAEAIYRVAGGLRAAQESGQELLPIFDKLGFANQRERRVMAGLVLGYEQLTVARRAAAEQTELMNEGLEEQLSMNQELERRLDTIGFQWRRFRAQIGVVTQVLGEYLAPTLRDIVDWLLNNRDAVVVFGSSIIGLVEILRYLADVFVGVAQIISGAMAKAGGWLGGAFSTGIYKQARSGLQATADAIRERMDLGLIDRAKGEELIAGLMAEMATLPATVEESAMQGVADVMSMGIERGTERIEAALERYMNYLEQIPEIQEKMYTSLRALSNNAENQVVWDELQALINAEDLEEPPKSGGTKKRTAADVLADLNRLIPAIDVYGLAMEEAGQKVDVNAEKTNAFRSALRELAEMGLPVFSEEIQSVVAWMNELGLSTEKTRDELFKLQEDLTNKYLTRIDLEFQFGNRSLESTVDELRFQRDKLTQQARDAVSAGDFESATSIARRLDAVTNALDKYQDMLLEIYNASPGVRLAQMHIADSAALVAAKFDDSGKRIRFTLQAVEQSEGVFTSINDALLKLARSGVQVTGEMMDYLTDRFKEASRQIRAINQDVRILREALERRYSVDNAGFLATIQAVERTEGRITSLSDAFQKFSNVGVVMTGDMMKWLADRFKEAGHQVRAVNQDVRILREAMERRWGAPDATFMATLQMVERTEGRITSLNDAFRKFASTGVVMTGDMMKWLTERFKEADQQIRAINQDVRILREALERRWGASNATLMATLQMVERTEGKVTSVDDAFRKFASAGIPLTGEMLEWLIERLEKTDEYTTRLAYLGQGLTTGAGHLSGWASRVARAAGVVTTAIDKAIDAFDDLKKAQEEQDPEKRAALTASAQSSLFGAIAEGLGGVSDLFGGPPEGIENEVFQGVFALAGAIAEIATGIPGLSVLGAAVGGFLNTIIGDLSNGRKQIEEQIKELEKSFSFVRAADIVETKRVSRGGILGFLGFTKEAIDEDATNIKVSMAEAIESGMSAGFTAAITKFMKTGEWDDLQAVVKDALLQGLIEGYMASEAFKTIFGDALAEYINDPSAEAAQKVLAGIDDFKNFWERVRSDFGGFFDDAADVVGDFSDVVKYQLPDATLSLYGTPQWIQILGNASIDIREGARDIKEIGTRLIEEGIKVNLNQSGPSKSELSPQSVRAI